LTKIDENRLTKNETPIRASTVDLTHLIYNTGTD